MLALDAKGVVWSWGTNDKGQLGHSNDQNDASVKDTPKKITKIKDIVQIYAGEFSSFAVN